MERDIDLTPQHLLDWLRDDMAHGGRERLAVRATREFLTEDGPLGAMGIDVEDDISVMTTIGLLEVAPPPGGHHWVLRIRVEDPVGEHLPDDGSVPDGPEEIGLEEFEACFLASEDLSASVTVEAATAADRQSFERVLARMIRDRHR
jgi:hypothetical protein